MNHKSPEIILTDVFRKKELYGINCVDGCNLRQAQHLLVAVQAANGKLLASNGRLVYQWG